MIIAIAVLVSLIVSCVAGIILLVFIDTVVFLFNQDRGRELMGLHALFIRSVLKSKAAAGKPAHHHKRRDDDVEHEHRRKTPMPHAQTITDFVHPPEHREPKA